MKLYFFNNIFNLSSNSPLNLVPAIRSGKSKATNLYSPILSGTDFSIILILIPSAKAVFPRQDRQ